MVLKTALLTSILITLVSAAILTSVLMIPSSGTITVKTLGVQAFHDPECNSEVMTIQWGDIPGYLGQNINETIYLRLTGNVPATLTLSSSNHQPIVVSLYLELSWNYSGTIIQPNTVYPVTLTLTMIDTIMQEIPFSFNILISAEDM